jgi:hypothetical protein
MASKAMRLAFVGIVMAVAPGVSRAVPAEHIVSGVVQVRDGAWLGIEALSDALGPIPGRAWLGGELPLPSIEITLDCLDVTWQPSVYPIPPYLPYHRVQASGTGSDGVRYFITAYDASPRPVGFGDYATVTAEPADGACGAHPEAAAPVMNGNLTISP